MIADLAQNSVEAGASLITLCVDETDASLSFELCDNGKGMSPALLERVKDPFYTDGVKHPSRKVGLGIPFLIQTATDTGGSWNIVSSEGKGTTVSGSFDKTNIDTPPVGNVAGLFCQALTQPGSYEMVVQRAKTVKGTDALDYEAARSELTEALGELETVDSLSLLRQYLEGLETGGGEEE
jgi:hypothetical protein